MSEGFYANENERWNAIQKSKSFDDLSLPEEPSAPSPAESVPEGMQKVHITHDRETYDAIEASARFVNSINDPLTELEAVNAGQIRPDIIAEREQDKVAEAAQMPLHEAVSLLLLRKSASFQAIFGLIANEYESLTLRAEQVENSNPNLFQRATALKDVLRKIGGRFLEAESRLRACDAKTLHAEVPVELHGLVLRDAAKQSAPPNGRDVD